MSNISPQSFSRPKYRADIDGMRALAILSVLIFHAYPSSLPGGFVGVDVFFVISGYLISGIIFRGLTLGSFSFFDFYARRIRRIFPAVTVVLLTTYILGVFFVTPFVMKDMLKEAPYAAFFIENVRLFLQRGEYWDVGTELKPYMHFWSLGVEEQYYIFYPLICFFLWKASSKVFLSSLLLMLVMSFGLCLYDTATEPIRAFYLLHARFWELLIGGVLAYIELKWPNYKEITLFSVGSVKRINNLLSALGVVLIIGAIAFFEEGESFPGWRALLPTVGAVLIIMAGSEAYLNKRFFAHKVAVFIGLISYPLYLWHWPLISIVRNNLGGATPTGILVVILVLCSFILAYLTYVLVERPLRSIKATWRLVGILVVVLLLSTVGIKEISRKNDMLERWMLNNLPQGVAEVRNEFYETEPYDPDCIKVFGGGHSICQKKGENPTTVVFGDSHAILSWNYLRANNSVPLLLVGNHGGVIFRRVSRLTKEGTEVQDLTNQFWEVLSQSQQIDTVVFIGYWAAYLNYEIKSNLNPEWNIGEIYRNHWRDIFKELSRLNKNVIVVLDNPTIPVKYQFCLLQNFHRVNFVKNKSSSCSFSIEQLSENEKKSIQILQEEAAMWPNVRVVDLKEKLCPDGVCQIFNGTLQMYRDDDHLSPFGYQMVWPEIDKEIRSIK